jgi:hypothetical protein
MQRSLKIDLRTTANTPYSTRRADRHTNKKYEQIVLLDFIHRLVSQKIEE